MKRTAAPTKSAKSDCRKASTTKVQAAAECGACFGRGRYPELRTRLADPDRSADCVSLLFCFLLCFARLPLDIKSVVKISIGADCAVVATSCSALTSWFGHSKRARVMTGRVGWRVVRVV
jgi:hypothetical protein